MMPLAWRSTSCERCCASLGGNACQLDREAPCPVVLVAPQTATQREGLNRSEGAYGSAQP